MCMHTYILTILLGGPAYIRPKQKRIGNKEGQTEKDESIRNSHGLTVAKYEAARSSTSLITTGQIFKNMKCTFANVYMCACMHAQKYKRAMTRRVQLKYLMNTIHGLNIVIRRRVLSHCRLHVTR